MGWARKGEGRGGWKGSGVCYCQSPLQEQHTLWSSGQLPNFVYFKPANFYDLFLYPIKTQPVVLFCCCYNSRSQIVFLLPLESSACVYKNAYPELPNNDPKNVKALGPFYFVPFNFVPFLSIVFLISGV